MNNPLKLQLRESTAQYGSTNDQLPGELHSVLRRILLGRGVTNSEQFDLSLQQLARPEFGGIQQAAALLADAVSDNRKIMIVGDFDADGATGSAVAMLGLQAMGAQRVDYCVPNRFEFGYGLSTALVESIQADSPELLVTVDNGISSVRGVELANACGQQVIVTDHHLPGETLPDAAAIVNPNLPGDPFPSKALAGVGVMFYLLSQVRAELQQRGWFGQQRKAPNLGQLLDLVALGTVADMVPLDHNNRILVQAGLQRIRAGQARPGIHALLKVAGTNHRLCTATDLAWRVAPRLNAAGRLEDMRIGIECLLSSDEDQAHELAAVLDNINHERRKVQQDMQSVADQQITELLADLKANEIPQAFCLFDESWHQGVVGLVAGKVKEALHRPVIALAPESEGSDVLKGSVRSVTGVHIRDALALLDARHPEMMQRFGGHAMAAGLSLPRQHLQDFKIAWSAIADDFVLPEQTIISDGQLQEEDFSLQLARLLESAMPWGQKFPEPLFDGRFEVLDRQVVAVKHVRLLLQQKDSTAVQEAIAFNRDVEAFPKGSSGVHLAYRLQVNRFRGRESVQLLVEHVMR